METIDDVLAHFGVKGMKWGVRKSSGGGSSSAAPKPKPKVSEDAAAAKAAKAKAKTHSTDALSNKELQHLVNRMNLEQQYGRLKKGNPNPGVKFARELLVGVGKQQAIKLANDAVSKQIAVAIGNRKK
jgi:hypothetical protein